MLLGYTGLRWGELVGLEPEYIRPGQLRVEWQLYELDNAELHRCPPKDESRRTLDLPEWLSELLAEHLTSASPSPCTCHSRRYAFRGYTSANGAADRQQGARMGDVARKAGVSTGTVSNVLNRPDRVAETTRATVLQAMTELGYIRGASPRQLAPHWRRSGFASWLFQPAVTGRYPRRGTGGGHPVPLLADPCPGLPARGRNASGRAECCWLPLAPGLTPHGLRHTHRTIMEELGIASKLMDERMGHEDGSVQARYTHITNAMRERLTDGLTTLWTESLDQRRRLAPRSPVGALDRLLQQPKKSPPGDQKR